MDDPAQLGSTPAQNTEDVVAKYKRLLSMARSSLEANQVDLKEKDKYIQQLKQALEEEKAREKSSKRPGQKEDDALIPRSLLRRVEIEHRVWILVEYEAGADGRNVDDRWLSFSSEEDLDDFVQRIPGVPLQKPHRSLTPSESNQIVSSVLMKFISKHSCNSTNRLCRNLIARSVLTVLLKSSEGVSVLEYNYRQH